MPCELELETTNMICSCPNTQDEWIKSETELSKSAPGKPPPLHGSATLSTDVLQQQLTRRAF